ncbi:Vms1/Ankzf1 family peptidyl-tRNA hydrolase [Streptomyces sp. NPDC059785]|uniref:baeRF2 domain-containing protein n=1 Tax=unclassified Streptomyces TaxID=2593676 RepID=UPI00364FDA74
MDLAFLHPLYEHSGPWASVYVDTSRHTESTPHERSLTAQAVSRELAAQGADRATCEAVHAAVDELRHSTEPHGRAFFAAHGEVVLAPSLAAPPPGTEVFWGPLPRTAPLVELAGEDPLCLVAYIDRRGADFELRSALGSEEAGSVTGDQYPVHRTRSADWSEKHFQLKVENTWEKNAEDVARALAACQEDSRADLLVLVGDARERHAVREHLPKALHDRTVEETRGSGSRLLDDDVERIRAEHVRLRTTDELDRFLAARSPDDEGRKGAAEGVPALVEAALEHRIDELLLCLDGPDAHREVWIGPDPDQIAVRRSDAAVLGERDPVSARADDALMRSAVMTDAPAISVAGVTSDEVPAGGLGALLRWK